MYACMYIYSFPLELTIKNLICVNVAKRLTNSKCTKLWKLECFDLGLHEELKRVVY
ncbi:hypothetical protein LguiB_028538 [Lonicera macranthoides]